MTSWTREQVDEIAEECLATDIVYDVSKMQGWSEDKIREFFENGGAEEAPAPPEISMPAVKRDIWTYMPDEVKWRSNDSVAVRFTTNCSHRQRPSGPAAGPAAAAEAEAACAAGDHTQPAAREECAERHVDRWAGDRARAREAVAQAACRLHHRSR